MARSTQIVTWSSWPMPTQRFRPCRPTQIDAAVGLYHRRDFPSGGPYEERGVGLADASLRVNTRLTTGATRVVLLRTERELRKPRWPLLRGPYRGSRDGWPNHCAHVSVKRTRNFGLCSIGIDRPWSGRTKWQENPTLIHTIDRSFVGHVQDSGRIFSPRNPDGSSGMTPIYSRDAGAKNIRVRRSPSGDVGKPSRAFPADPFRAARTYIPLNEQLAARASRGPCLCLVHETLDGCVPGRLGRPCPSRSPSKKTRKSTQHWIKREWGRDRVPDQFSVIRPR